MKDLTKEQIDVLRTKLIEYRENFAQNRDISSTRERARVVISQLFGEPSAEYRRFISIGAYTWHNADYSDKDIQNFISFFNGILDTFDILSV